MHAILQWFICAKADRDMQRAGLSGAVCLCACMCECVSVCVRARARVSGSRCPRSPPLFWWSDSCEKPPLVAPSALAVSNFLSHCRLNVTSALELEFYPIVRRQPSPQRHRELPEKQDSAIFIEAEKGEKKASFIWKGGGKSMSLVSSAQSRIGEQVLRVGESAK